VASLKGFQPQQEEPAPLEDIVEESPAPQEGTGGSGLVPEEGEAGDIMEPQEQPGAADDTLPHTNPEMQEGIGGSGPIEQGDVDPVLPDEPQFPEEPLVIPPLEALKPFSEGQEGTGGSGPVQVPGGMTQQQVAPQQRNPVIGQVHASNRGQLVVQDVQRDVYALTLEPNACISRDGKAISLEQLDAGDTVRARWSVREGKRVATWVDVLRDAPPSPQQGTGGSGWDDDTGLQGDEPDGPLVEPLGNDEFQGH
jgi:hypothetical protein